tara:strand:- start:105 stop:326 length:222 start_codon:yes stop_codon:yes gene_type:complete
MEKLDTANIIEIDRIRQILKNHPDLLSMFEIMVIIANNRINQESISLNMEIEENTEPELSDHESDEEEIFKYA